MVDDAFEGRRNYVSHFIELHPALYHRVKVKSLAPAPEPERAPAPERPPPSAKLAHADLLSQLAKDDPDEANAAAIFLMEHYLR